MRVIETKVFEFEELSQEAKDKAIENFRNLYYEGNDFLEWAIDDCALLEPTEKELTDLFGKDYNFPLIENNRKVYLSLDRDRHIDISNAMVITDDNQFLEWLGIKDEDFVDEEGYHIVDYTIGEDTIEFEPNTETEFTEKQEKILEEAKDKFEQHCEDILNRVEVDCEYRFSDEAIIEDIEANEREFTEEGELI